MSGFVPYNFTPMIVEKVWGHEIWFANDREANYCGKELRIKKGMQCSMHMHPIKTETFYVVDGCVVVEWLPDATWKTCCEVVLVTGTSFHVPAGMYHRFTARPSTHDYSRVIEVSTYHDDADVVRLTESGPRLPAAG